MTRREARKFDAELDGARGYGTDRVSTPLGAPVWRERPDVAPDRPLRFARNEPWPPLLSPGAEKNAPVAA